VRRAGAAAAALAFALAGQAARAAESGGVVYDLRTDGALTIAAATAAVGSEVVIKNLLDLPLDANWRKTDGLDRSIRNALVWKDPGQAAKISYGTFGLTVATGFGLSGLSASSHGGWSELGVDALLITEAMALDGAVNQAVKFAARRARPLTLEAMPAAHDPTQKPNDFNLSFYSEHTSLSFALAGSAGMIAHLRGYRWAPAIWIATAALGATTAYLRIAADEHWFTDVLTGAALGTAIGAGVPYLFHRPCGCRERRAFFAAVPTGDGGGMLTYSGNW
jgi:membrane-associated phospholipid phosphatase